MRFCGNEVTLRTGTYLPKNNNEYITFKQRVKDLHMNHLLLYRDYIQKNYNHIGIGEDDMLDRGFDSSITQKIPTGRIKPVFFCQIFCCNI